MRVNHQDVDRLAPNDRVCVCPVERRIDGVLGPGRATEAGEFLRLDAGGDVHGWLEGLGSGWHSTGCQGRKWPLFAVLWHKTDV